MELEHQMLVSEYAQNVIDNRPLKYGTRQSYIKIIKSLGIWETEISDLNCALIFDKVDQMRSHNVKKNVYICLRSVFKDLGIFNELPILEGISKVYDFPTQEELHQIIEGSKYRRILYLFMYAGLRVGEACAVIPSQLEGNMLTVDRAISQDGLHLGRLMRRNGLEPLEPFVDSKKKWKCRHLKCGNIVYPIYNTIQNRGGGCSTCAEWGLTYNAPAYLYILQHDVYQSIKIGISNDSATPNRVRSHQLDGWKHYKSFYFETGQIAEDMENEVLNWLRNERQLGIHLAKEQMKQGGYSETVDALEISVLEIERYIGKVLGELND